MLKSKVSVFIATSLDGYIARKNGDLDWLDEANNTVTKGEDCGYTAFMSSIDVLVMGRLTYEKVLSFGAWPYQNKPVIVLSSKAVEIPAAISSTVSHSSEAPGALVDRLSSEGVNRIYIDGGITIQRFLVAGLVNDMVLTIIPIILGSGKPLFSLLKDDVHLKHVATKSFEFGFVQINYEIIANT